MDKELATKLLEMLTGAQDFVLTQAPDVIQQLLVYSFWKAIVGVVIGAALLGAATWAASGIRAAYEKGKNECDPSPAFLGRVALVIFGGVAGSMTFLNAGHSALFVALAPKLFLIEYLRGLTS